MSRRSRYLVGGAILLALLSAIAWQAARNHKPVLSAHGDASNSSQYFVVTATKRIRRGTKIEPGLLELHAQPQVPKAGSFAAKEQALGRVALVEVAPHADLGTFNTADNPAGLGLASLIPKGMRAITIGVSDEIAVGNWIRAGDRVDVLLVGISNASKPGEADTNFRAGEARTILENQMVLAVGDSIVGDSSNEHAYRHVTLAVTPRDAAFIALAGAVGSYHLSLRARDDEVPTPNFVATTRELTSQTSSGAQGITGALDRDSLEIISGTSRQNVPIGRQQ